MPMNDTEQVIKECVETINGNASSINDACEKLAKLPRVTAKFAAAQVMSQVIGARWQATRARLQVIDLA